MERRQFLIGASTILTSAFVAKAEWFLEKEKAVVPLIKDTTHKPVIYVVKNDFDYELRHISSPFRQQLTHRTIIATFLEIDLPVNFSIKKNAYIKVERKNLSRFAFPKIIDLYLKDNSLNLYSMFQDLK